MPASYFPEALGGAVSNCPSRCPELRKREQGAAAPPHPFAGAKENPFEFVEAAAETGLEGAPRIAIHAWYRAEQRK